MLLQPVSKLAGTNLASANGINLARYTHTQYIARAPTTSFAGIKLNSANGINLASANLAHPLTRY